MAKSQFQSLLKNSSLDKLRDAFKSAGAPAREDDGYWKSTQDKAGNATAIFRFLPAPPPEQIPFASFYRHSFKGPGGWYIELSRTSIGEQDPVSDFNSKLWATQDKVIQDQVRSQSRKKTYVANIYIIQDKAKPENEGKVFPFRFGQKIFDKIQKCLNPEFEQDVAFDPFHPISGANFRFRQKKQQNFPNYDDSSFETPKPLLNGDEAALTTVFEQMKSLTDIVAPDKFKSYEVLKKQLDRAMGFDTSVYLTPNQAANDTGMRIAPSAGVTAAKAPVTTATKWTPPPVVADDEPTDEDVDDRLSKFDDD